MIQELYFSICPQEMAMHLKKEELKTIQKLKEKAKNYIEAHATGVVFEINPKNLNIQTLRPKMRQCHNCKVSKHLQTFLTSKMEKKCSRCSFTVLTVMSI